MKNEVGGGLRKVGLEEVVGIEWWVNMIDQNALDTCTKFSKKK